MKNQVEQAHLLKKLHVKGDPLVLVNVWDAGSAKAIQESGAQVVATGSWSVAASHGSEDGEKLPFDLVIANLKRIAASVDLPVTIDLETGYGKTPQDVQQSVIQVIEGGAVGINLEDQNIGLGKLYSVADQCERIQAAHTARQQSSLPLFINARTDLFLNSAPSDHNDELIEEAIHRARAYAEAGADGFFTPGLRDAILIEKICSLSPIPINIMVLPDTPSLKQLAKLGVARISYGPGPYHLAMNALQEAGRKALSKDH